MDLLNNPFHILGATQRDDRQRIMELEEKQSLFSDSDACIAARTVLINPRNRISAEVAWLPGVNPGHIESVLKQLDSPNQNLLNIIGLSAIASANVFSAGLSRISNIESSELMKWTLAIVHVYEKIDVVEARDILNEERNYSGFPQITDLSVIEVDIQNQKSYYTKTLSNAFKLLSVNERASILNLILEETKDKSNDNYPDLINKLIESYEKEVKNDLEKKQRIIAALDEKLRAMVDAKRPDSELELIVNQLIQAVKDWDTIAQPIQLIMESSGKHHTVSFEIAGSIRKLAVDIHNDYGKSEFSQRLLTMLSDAFAEEAEIVEPIEKDQKELKARIQEEKSYEQFKVVETIAEKLKEAADKKKPASILTPIVRQLMQTVKTWETSSHPIEANCAVAIVVRNIALHLWNEHQKLEIAMLITYTIVNHFKGVNGMEEINHKLNEDMTTYNEIEVQRKQITLPKDDGLSGCLTDRIITYLVVFGIGGILALIGSLMEGC